MPKYFVQRREDYTVGNDVRYAIEANSPEEAARKVVNGDCTASTDVQMYPHDTTYEEATYIGEGLEVFDENNNPIDEFYAPDVAEGVQQ